LRCANFPPSGRSAGSAIAEGAISAAVYSEQARRFVGDLGVDAKPGRTYAIKYSIERPGVLSFVSDWKITAWIEDVAL